MISYIVKNKDFIKRIESRSGGIFVAISDWVLENGGVVYGCALNDEFMAVHKRAISKEERDLFRGSKYIQSDIRDVIPQVLDDLNNDKKVLFSGTACQIDAVKSLCPKDKSTNLICIDIVCHGVPSSRVWKDYLSYIEKKKHGKVQSVNFRNKKKYGWWAHVETLVVNGKEYDSRVFADLFMNHDIIRNSCFHCPYKNLNRVGDITIADAWNIQNDAPDFDDDCGVSLVLINTENGKTIFEKIKSKCEYRECNVNKYIQEPLCKNFNKSDNYDLFWNQYTKMTFEEVININCRESIGRILKRKMKGFIRSKQINKKIKSCNKK